MIIGVFLLAFTTCKKDPEPPIETFGFEKENVTVASTSATIVGTYSYSGVIDGIKVHVSENGVNMEEFAAEMNGKNFTVILSGLKPGTEYQYYYVVDYGFSKPFITDARTFTTRGEVPMVKTIEAIAIDSITVRVKCEVVSDGGAEVTERGICWNTFGDPSLDDDTLRHNMGGIGQYTLRMENLVPNTYYVRAYAKNASGTSFGEVLEFFVGSETILPQVSTVEVSDITATSARCLGNVAADGGSQLIECGVCWSLQANPNVNGSHAAAEEAALGVFSVNITGLDVNKTYFVRAYATNNKGTAYGEELTFTTSEGLPVVKTLVITDITATSANGGGEVIDQGASAVTERGICWSTNHTPTTNNSHAYSGTGVGSYTVSMYNLTPNATYYVRAYATNTQGTAYGAEVSFTALEGLPVVTTQEVTDITAYTAKGHGNVTEQGGSTVTERGICWSTEPSPTINGNHANSGTGAGEFTVSLTNLNPGTKYYVRAYAKNSQGTTYGEQKDFTSEATVPTVITGDINGTMVSGEVTDDGGAVVTERGICWGTNHNPTTSGTHGSSGTGMGTYTVELTGLEPATTYYVRAYATNSAGTAYGEEKFLTTAVALPIVTTSDISNITQTTATGGGNVSYDGGSIVTERGLCWSVSQNPTINNSHTSDGTGTGSFISNLTDLSDNTTYYVRAYATNEAGTSYGEQKTFTTLHEIALPTITTSNVTDITQTTAVSGGNVTSAGYGTVSARGVCWSTSQNPTISNSHTSDGNGIGVFTSNITGLTENTTYYVRAYATNEAGTSYGEQKTFTTPHEAILPSVTTSNVTDITQTAAVSGGNVSSAGYGTVSARGVCWSTSQNPTISNSHTSDGNGTGVFTSNITGLTENTTYYVRAYATNEAGTSYGEQKTFTTLHEIALPTVTTSNVTDITQTMAVSGGNVTSAGYGTVSARGVCWSTSQNPTISNSHTSDGNGTGVFTSNITGLTESTTYYVRAYATNEAGTAYGEQKIFTTDHVVVAPVVITSNVSNVFISTATCGGNVTSAGYGTVSARGVCWSTSHFPTINNSHTNDGTGTGVFVSNITGLTGNTAYYVRAYATNEVGTSYGDEYYFVTEPEQTWQNGILPGPFSVGTQQVHFSQGNLQYRASTNTWRFATNQYDYIGNDNSNASSTYNGWIDFFGWGTSGYNHGAVAYEPWNTSGTPSDYYAYGNYIYNLYDQTGQADWGYNPILNGGNVENYWRTLTKDEWDYLLFSRNTVSGIRYAMGRVNGVCGTILLPDDWNNSTYTFTNPNTPTPYEDNDISSSDWTSILEVNGAVFLPSAGYRYNGAIHYVNFYASYWASNATNSTTCGCVGVLNNGFNMMVYTSNGDRQCGSSVRLVH